MRSLCTSRRSRRWRSSKAVVVELERAVAGGAVEGVGAEGGEGHRVALLLLPEPEVLVTSAYMPPTDDGKEHLLHHLDAVAGAEAERHREGAAAEALEVLAPAVDGQDRRVVERAAQVGLVGVAEVVLEVEVGRVSPKNSPKRW